jgi:AraC-like DNA-binding protein
MSSSPIAIYSELFHAAHFTHQYQFLRPAPELQTYVDCYWQLDLQAAAPTAPAFQEQILATLQASLVINLGTPFHIFGLPGQAAMACSSSLAIGHQRHPLTYQHAPGNVLVGIKFRPAAFHRIFGIRTADGAGAPVPAEFLLADVGQVEERLRRATSALTRQHTLDALVREALQQHQDVRLIAVHRACHPGRLAQARYRLTDLAASLCLTPRTLERYFAYVLDLPPKTCLRIARFRQALPAYARLGYRADYEALGYHDFSHFLKDYHCFSQ